MRILLVLATILSSFYLCIKAPQIHRNFLYKYIGQSTVKVVLQDPVFGQILGGGTGFEVQYHHHKYIITNRHVCLMYDGGKIASVVLPDGVIVHREIVQISELTDLCAIESVDDLPGLRLGSDPYIGELIALVGHPALLPLNVSYGAVLQETAFQVGDENVDAYLSNAEGLPGNSGSPVVNYKGEVVGVDFAGDNDIHWSLIIPGHDLKYFLESL
jgi:S1-C subfamily serine protease